MKLSRPLWILLGLALAIGLAIVAGNWLLEHPKVLPPKDFVEYWAAARVALDGGDPYDGAQLLPWQRWARDEPERTEAVMMWNPPWTLPVYYPLAELKPRPAQLLWLGLQLAAIVGGCILLWRVYGGPKEHLGAVPLIAISFYATLWTIKYGQNTGLIFLGLAGFAYAMKRGWPALAGACAALTALKPHLLAVFGVVFILDAIQRRGRIALGVGIAVVLAGLAVALAVNPNVLDQYLAALRRPRNQTAIPLSAWRLPQLAFYLRVALDAPFWSQFIPCAIACLAYSIYYWWKRHDWDWPRELPAIVWVSVLTAPYGGWIFDLVLLLVPIIAVSVRLAEMGQRSTIRLFAACYVVLTAATFLFARSLDEFYWVAPATLLLCLAARAVSAQPLAKTTRPLAPDS